MKTTNNENNSENKGVLATSAGKGFFEICVKGHLDESWSDWLEGMQVQLKDNGEMTLSGYIIDQAALVGILNKLHGLNLTLLSVIETNRKK
jgi:hypothetical protein